MYRLSPTHWLGVAAVAMIVALFLFNDGGPFPVFKPKTIEARVAQPVADSQVLEMFAADLRPLWDKDKRAYDSFRSGGAAAIQRREVKDFAISVAAWDMSLRAIENELQAVKVLPTANGKLKNLLDESAKAFAEALTHERRIAQTALAMMSDQLDISSEIPGEMKEVNVALTRSVLALSSAYQLLGMEPPPTPQH